MVIARIPLSVIAGILCTLAVFFGLWRLVGGPLDIGPTIVEDRVRFTRQIVDTAVRPKPPRPPKVEREQRREIPNPPGVKANDPDVVVEGRPTPIRFFGLPGTRFVGPGGGIPMGVDRDVTPLVQIKPEYPPPQQTRGVEGWVRVQFDVTPVGTVRNAIVVAAEPRGAFDEAALEAIARWRYNPRIVNGAAVERVGLQVLLRFTLEEAR